MSAHSLFRHPATLRLITAPRSFGLRRITTSNPRLSEPARAKKAARNGIASSTEATGAAADTFNEISDSGSTNAPTTTPVAVISHDAVEEMSLQIKELSLQNSAESKRLRERIRTYIADSEGRTQERLDDSRSGPSNFAAIMNMLVVTVSALWIESRLKRLESKLKPAVPSANVSVQEKEVRPAALLPEVQWQRTQSTLSRWFWASDRVLDAENALAAERQAHQIWLERSRQEWKAFLMRQEDLINKIGRATLSKLADGAMERSREEHAGKSQAEKDQEYMGMLSKSSK